MKIENEISNDLFTKFKIIQGDQYMILNEFNSSIEQIIKRIEREADINNYETIIEYYNDIIERYNALINITEGDLAEYLKISLNFWEMRAHRIYVESEYHNTIFGANFPLSNWEDTDNLISFIENVPLVDQPNELRKHFKKLKFSELMKSIENTINNIDGIRGEKFIDTLCNIDIYLAPSIIKDSELDNYSDNEIVITSYDNNSRRDKGSIQLDPLIIEPLLEKSLEKSYSKRLEKTYHFNFNNYLKYDDGNRVMKWRF